MKRIQKLLLVHLILIICSLAVFSARNQDDKSVTESQEKQSLFDTGEDDDDNETTIAYPSSSPDLLNSTSSTTEKPGNPKTKPKSRQITLPDDYNKLEIPRKPNMRIFLEKRFGPDVVLDEEVDDDDFGNLDLEIDVKVRNIRDVDELNEEITVELDFIAKWMDAVILFENKDIDPLELLENENLTMGIRSLDPAFLKRIWKPDIFIENVVSISRPELITKPTRLLFSPAGYIVFSTRVTVKMDCEMEFHYYPADTQLCVFKLRSYSYTTKDLNITWDEAGPFLNDRSEHNFDVKLDILDSYDLVEAEGLLDETYSETYRVLQFQISARRKLSFQLIQTYLPSTFFIIITWLSFLVPATMIEARIGISMTTLLTLTSMFASVRENSPIVSYVKAIDIWMVACVFFVFLTLLEFTLLTWRRHLNTTVLLVHENEPSEVGVKDERYDYDPLDITDKADTIVVNNLGGKSVEYSVMDKCLKRLREQDIEKYGFRSFSLLFVVFNVIYWPWLLLSSGYLIWNVDFTYNTEEE